MRVASVRVWATVQRAAGPRVSLRVPSSCEDEGYGRYDANHENDSSYAYADREVALGYADLVFFL